MRLNTSTDALARQTTLDSSSQNTNLERLHALMSIMYTSALFYKLYNLKA